MKFTRITVNPKQMGGVPCIRGLRIPVATIVGMIADGMTQAEILKAYPDLEPDDIHEALRYAAESSSLTMLCRHRWRKDCGKVGMMPFMYAIMAYRRPMMRKFLHELPVKSES